jgi:arylsulfatase A-like enzyme
MYIHVIIKNCAPSAEEETNFYATARQRRIRRIYYAMIAEFDGANVSKLEVLVILENTVVIVTSDHHGDMNMEHQQFCNMSAFEASVRVPLIMAWKKKSKSAGF